MSTTTTKSMIPTADTGPLLTIPAVAQHLSISRSTVYRLVESRKIAFIKVGGVVRFRRADVEAYLGQNRVEVIK